MTNSLNDSDVTSSLAPPTPADSLTAIETETANQATATPAASHGGGSFSSQSETSKLSTGNKPSTETQTSVLSESPEAGAGEPSQLITSAPTSSAQSARATPPEEEEDVEEDEDEELGKMNNVLLQNENVLKF